MTEREPLAKLVTLCFEIAIASWVREQLCLDGINASDPMGMS